MVSHLIVTLADGSSAKILLLEGTTPEMELRAFLDRTGSYRNGPWVELASGWWVHYDQIVSVRIHP